MLIGNERKKVEELFKQDVGVRILNATDAAGEGINLQRAYLMINYDLPWNPNRLEQRFGRIHRIGQAEELMISPTDCKAGWLKLKTRAESLLCHRSLPVGRW